MTDFMVFLLIRVICQFYDMFILFHFRNASKKNETQSQINEFDMYDLPNAKSGKIHFERLELEGTSMYHLFFY